MPTDYQLELLIESRLTRVADLALQGWRQADIGRELGISQAAVSRDLAEVRTRWRSEAIASFADMVTAEVAKTLRIEREAWSAWHRSIGTKEKTTIKADAAEDGETGRTTTKFDENGDPRYLAIVESCIARRCRLLGLEPQPKTGMQILMMSNEQPPQQPIGMASPAERAARLEGIARKLRDDRALVRDALHMPELLDDLRARAAEEDGYPSLPDGSGDDESNDQVPEYSADESSDITRPAGDSEFSDDRST